MNVRLLPLVLSLLLLAGCTPPPEPTPSSSPAPEPQPTPVAGRDLDAFLAEINARRRAVIETEASLDVSAWTHDFTEQNGTYTEEEMDLLLTPHDLAEPLTAETAREDVDAFFTLLRTTYGAYEYFGGDEVFAPLEEQALAQLEKEAAGWQPLISQTIQDVLLDTLSPVLRDGHFRIGDQHPLEPYQKYMYYVPNLYLPNADGLDPDYVKPTIGPEGQICYGFYTPSHDGTDLPDTLGDYDLHWVQAGSGAQGRDTFTEYSYQDIPVLQSTQMYAAAPGQEAQLERFAACGGEYVDEPVLIFDVRAHQRLRPGTQQLHFLPSAHRTPGLLRHRPDHLRNAGARGWQRLSARPVGRSVGRPGRGRPAVQLLQLDGRYIKKQAAQGPPALPLKFGFDGLLPGIQPLPGKQPVDAQGHDHTHAGVQHAVEGVGDIIVRADGEQQQTEHHAAGLHRSHPEDLGQDDENDHAYEQEGHQHQVIVPLGVEDQVNAVEGDAQKAADDGAKQAVAAMELGVVHVGAHAENGADTGKGRIPAQKIVDEGAERGGKGSLEVTQSYMDGGLLIGFFHFDHAPERLLYC